MLKLLSALLVNGLRQAQTDKSEFFNFLDNFYSNNPALFNFNMGFMKSFFIQILIK